MEISPLFTWNKAASPDLELAFKMNECGITSRSNDQREQSENEYDRDTAATKDSQEHGNKYAITNGSCLADKKNPEIQHADILESNGVLKGPWRIRRHNDQAFKTSQDPYMADSEKEDDYLSFEELSQTDDEEILASKDRMAWGRDGPPQSSSQCHSICGLSCKFSRLAIKSPLSLDPETMIIYVSEKNGSAISGMGQVQNDDFETASDEDDWMSETIAMDAEDYELGGDVESFSSWSMKESQSFVFVTRKGSSPQLPHSPISPKTPSDKKTLPCNSCQHIPAGFMISPPGSESNSFSGEELAGSLPVETPISSEGKRSSSVKGAKRRRQRWPRDIHYNEDGYGP